MALPEGRHEVESQYHQQAEEKERRYLTSIYLAGHGNPATLRIDDTIPKYILSIVHRYIPIVGTSYHHRDGHGPGDPGKA